MLWFNKKKEEKEEQIRLNPIREVRDLYPPPQLPDLPKIKRLPELNAGGDPENIDKEKIYTKEIESSIQGIKKSPEEIKISSLPPLTKTNNSAPYTPSSPQSLRKETEPIFIKIEKFQSAKNNFEKIKEKVSDIDKMLKEVQELKQKESKELENWEQELQIIKTRINSIDDSLFKKLD